MIFHHSPTQWRELVGWVWDDGKLTRVKEIRCSESGFHISYFAKNHSSALSGRFGLLLGFEPHNYIWEMTSKVVIESWWVLPINSHSSFSLKVMCQTLVYYIQYMKYIIIWWLGESVTISLGMSYNGYDSESKLARWDATCNFSFRNFVLGPFYQDIVTGEYNLCATTWKTLFSTKWVNTWKGATPTPTPFKKRFKQSYSPKQVWDLELFLIFFSIPKSPKLE